MAWKTLKELTKSSLHQIKVGKLAGALETGFVTPIKRELVIRVECLGEGRIFKKKIAFEFLYEDWKSENKLLPPQLLRQDHN